MIDMEIEKLVNWVLLELFDLSSGIIRVLYLILWEIVVKKFDLVLLVIFVVSLVVLRLIFIFFIILMFFLIVCIYLYIRKMMMEKNRVCSVV